MLLQIMECVEDFESLMNLAISLSEGKDPNASLLFGPKRMFNSSLSCCLLAPVCC